MVSLAALTVLVPLVERVVTLLGDELARTKEPPEELAAAWRRMTEHAVDANQRVQNLKLIPLEPLPPGEREGRPL